MTQKRVPVLTIVSGILFLFLILGTVGFIYILFATSDMRMIWIVGGLVASLLIATFVLTILSKKDRLKGVMVPVLVLTIVLGNVNLFAAALGLIKQGVQESREGDYSQAIQMATLDRFMDRAPSKNMGLHTPETKGYSYTIYDDDGEVFKKMQSIEFTLSSSHYSETFNLPNTGDSYYLGSGSENLLIFDNDFDGLTVYAVINRGFLSRGPVRGENHYNMDPTEGASLKKMIDDKVTSQKAAYKAADDEALANVTFSATMDYFSNVNSSLLFTYYDKEHPEDELTDAIDSEKKVLDLLKSFDISAWRVADSIPAYSDKGFKYWAGTHTLCYVADRNAIIITNAYADPFKHERYVYAYYELPDVDATALIEGAVNISREMILTDAVGQ